MGNGSSSQEPNNGNNNYVNANELSHQVGTMDIQWQDEQQWQQRAQQLTVKQLDPEHDNYVWSIDNFLSDDECDQLVQLTERARYGDAPVTVGDNAYLMATDIRNNERVIWDDTVTANLLWQRLQRFVPERHSDLHSITARHGTNGSSAQVSEPMRACGLNERFRFYKYTSGQYFRPHFDGCFARKTVFKEELNAEVQERSYLTLLFYLSDVTQGGETIFYHSTSHRWRKNGTGTGDNNGDGGDASDVRAVVKPKKGSALLFVHSQLHAGADMPQDSNEIKYVMRSDVMFSRLVPVSVSAAPRQQPEEPDRKQEQEPEEGAEHKNEEMDEGVDEEEKKEGRVVHNDYCK